MSLDSFLDNVIDQRRDAFKVRKDKQPDMRFQNQGRPKGTSSEYDKYRTNSCRSRILSALNKYPEWMSVNKLSQRSGVCNKSAKAHVLILEEECVIEVNRIESHLILVRLANLPEGASEVE